MYMEDHVTMGHDAWHLCTCMHTSVANCPVLSTFIMPCHSADSLAWVSYTFLKDMPFWTNRAAASCRQSCRILIIFGSSKSCFKKDVAPGDSFTMSKRKHWLYALLPWASLALTGINTCIWAGLCQQRMKQSNSTAAGVHE